MNKLTIVLSGRKQSGKSSTCNYIRSRYLNLRYPEKRFGIIENGDLVGFSDGFKMLKDELDSYINRQSIKIYSFADPLKDFCINVFGVPYEGCWGTDEQKNALVEHLLWDNITMFQRWSAGGQQIILNGVITTARFSSEAEASFWNLTQSNVDGIPIGTKTGPMTGREIMQIFGTEICRKLYGDCWARGTYNKIKTEGYELALVADARFPNEITMGTTVNAKSVRMGRKVAEDDHASETALDGFHKDKYTLHIDNASLTLKEQCAVLDPHLDQWFAEAGII